jgi:hypothetical protein
VGANRMIFSIAAAIAIASGAVVAQPCTPYWTAMPPQHGFGTEFIAFDDGSGPALYANAIFAHWVAPSAVQRWTGHEWQLIGQGLPSNLDASMLPPHILDDGNGPRLYLSARWHTPVGPGWTSFIWTGEQWINGPANFLSEEPSGQRTSGPWFSYDDGHGSKIYGWVTIAFPDFALATWNGTSWEPIGVPAEGGFSSHIVYDDGTGPALYISGSFINLNGTGISYMARWDGTAWSQVGPNLAGPACQRMAVLNEPGGPALYCLYCISPSSPNCLRRWDGHQWTQIPGPDVPPGMIATVRTMEVFDDGSGEALYLGGSFPSVGGVVSRGLARWNGQQWSAVGNGISGEVSNLAVFMDDPRGPSLIARGVTSTRPGEVPSRIAQLVGCPNCYANCDGSSVHPRLNIDDFTCFINKFVARDPYANCDQNSSLDIDDFLCFISSFAQGCP